MGLAILQHVLAAAVGEVVAVLHGGHGEHPGRGLDLLDRDLAEPGVRDHAVVEQQLDRVELLVARHLGIDAVQLPQRDLLHAQPLAAGVCLAHQMAGVAVGHPDVGRRALEAALGGDGHAVVRVQRLLDQLLRYFGAIGIGRVDEVDAQLGQTAQRGERAVAVGRRAEDARARDAHRAVAQAVDLEFAADAEGPGMRGHGGRPVRCEGEACPQYVQDA